MDQIRWAYSLSVIYVYQYINVFMLNNGPSVTGLYIASSAPTNRSTIEFRCPLIHPFSHGTDSPFHNLKRKKQKLQLSPLPVQLVVGINDYKNILVAMELSHRVTMSLENQARLRHKHKWHCSHIMHHRQHHFLEVKRSRMPRRPSVNIRIFDNSSLGQIALNQVHIYFPLLSPVNRMDPMSVSCLSMSAELFQTAWAHNVTLGPPTEHHECKEL